MEQIDKIEFQIQKIASQVAFLKGLNIPPDRFEVSQIGNKVGIMLSVLTKESEGYKHPDGWWQTFKEEKFPKWLRIRFPIKYTEIKVIEIFPELDFPKEYLGRRFVQLKVVES